MKNKKENLTNEDERTPRGLDAELLTSSVRPRDWAEEIQVAEARRRLALDAAELGSWHLDIASQKFEIDERFRAIWGIPGDQAYEEALSYIHPDDQARVDDAIAAAIRVHDPAPYDIQYRIVHPDASIHWIHSKGRLNLHGPQHHEGAVTLDGTIADITEQKLREEALRRSEEKYRTLFESIDEGFCLLEVLFNDSDEAYDYVFLEANVAFERQSGLADAVGKSILELVPGLEPQWIKLYARVATTREPVRFDADVASMARSFDIYAFSNGDNKVAVVFNDITARKRQEANLAFLAEASRELVALTNIGDTMNALGAKIGAYFRATRIGFFEFNEAADEAVCEYEWKAKTEDISFVGHFSTADFYTDADEFISTLLAGEVFVLGDGTADARVLPESLTALNVRSFIIVPAVRDPQLPLVVLALNDNKPREWREDEIDLIRELTARIWIRLERARAEEALRESQKRLQLALDAAEMGTFLWYPQEDRTEMDGRALRVLGLGDGDTMTLASALAEAIHPDDRELYAAAVAAAIDAKGDGKLDLDYRVVHPDRSVHWLHIYGHTFFSAGNSLQPALMYGMVLDITGRKRAEASLRESEERYSALFAASPVPFMVLAPNAPDFTITAANDAYFAVTQTTRESLVGRRLFDVFPDDPSRPGQLGSEALAISLDRVLTTRTTDAMERVRYDLVIPGGGFDPHWWEAINAPMLDASGAVSAIIHQVTRVTELHYRDVAELEKQKHDAFLLRLGDALRAEPTPEAIAIRTLGMLMDEMRLARCYVGIYRLAEDIGEFPHQVHDDRMPPLPAQVRLSDFPEALEVAFDRTLVIDDAMEGLSDIDKTNFSGLGMRALIAATLRKGDNNPIWAINAVSTSPRVWTQGEISLVEEVAERTWAAIERRRSEEALAASELRMRLAINAANMYSWEINIETRTTTISEDSAAVLGFRRIEGSANVSEQVATIIHPDDQAVLSKALEQAYETGDLRQEMRFIVPGTGEIVWAETRGTVRRDADGKAVKLYGVTQNISERKQAEAALARYSEELEAMVAARTRELRETNKGLKAENKERRRPEAERLSLLAAITTVQEDERRRMALDLHDHFGQQLTALKFRIEILGMRGSSDDQFQQTVADAITLLRQIDDDVDALSFNLRPPSLDDVGLTASLQAYAGEWSRRFQIPVHFQASQFGSKRLPPDSETHIYRITQEILTNIQKHAGAGLVDIVLVKRQGAAVLSVKDDGIGFSLKAGRANRVGSGGLGLVGMRERATIIGGTLDIVSVADVGTTITLRVPIPRARIRETNGQ